MSRLISKEGIEVQCSSDIQNSIQKEMIFRPLIYLIAAILVCGSCSLSRRINEQIRETYEYDNGKMLGGDYVYKNRKIVLNKIPNEFFRRFDSLILIEKVIYFEPYYNCAVFGDSLRCFFMTDDLEDPKQINLNKKPLYTPELALYIFEKVKKGELKDVLKQGENDYYTHSSAVFLTLIKKTDKNINVSGHHLREFMPREKRMKLDSIKRAIKQISSDK